MTDTVPTPDEPDSGTAVLLIEESPTLRYALEKHLLHHGFRVRATASFETGMALLPGRQEELPDDALVIIGWPAATHPAADELFSLLEGSRFAGHPVLILANDPDPATRTWVIRRAHTAMLDWRHLEEITDTIAKLRLSMQSAPVEVPAGNGSEPRASVLFVDDSPSIRAYYRRLLTAQGYSVDVAASVDEAYDKACRHDYDIAVIDYFMPGANGDALCQRLRDNPATRHIVTAIFTSTYLDQVIKDSLDAGATECMFKDEADALFLTRIAAMCRSVGSRKDIEAERQRLQSILYSVGDGVYGVDNAGRITFVNPAVRLILGYDTDHQLTGEPAHELFHLGDDSGTCMPPDGSVLKSAYGSPQVLRNWEASFRARSGKPIPVECTVYPLYLGQHQQGSVVAFRDVSERKSLEERLRWQATHDPLTELFNRRYFEEQLEREYQWLQRHQGTCALLYLDLDHFKYVNDTAGHNAGDALLVQAGQRLRERLRKTDILARLGGDEFAIIMRNIDPDSIEAPAETFRNIIGEQAYAIAGRNFSLDASMGLTLFDGQAPSPGDILAQADIACHVAKQHGGNQLHVYSEAEDRKEEMDRDLGWSNHLRNALLTDRFVLRYQPILPLDCLADIEVPALSDAGDLWNRFAARNKDDGPCYEVLLRLRSDEDLEIAPQCFIPTAERFHLMPEIDAWVLRNSLARLVEVRREYPGARFSVNVSGHTLCQRDWPSVVSALLQDYPVGPDCLTFEVTETAAICDLTAAQRSINLIRELGCRFSLDDFGTGFSSFSHLKHLQVDNIKIDGMFVQAMTHDPIDHAMVMSMNDIAHCLGCRTIAEYVDNRDVLMMLMEIGVDHVQGNYISPPLLDPLRPEEFTETECRYYLPRPLVG